MTLFPFAFARTFSLLRLCLIFCLSAIPASLLCQQQSPTILWPTPDPIPFLSPLGDLQLNAIALQAPPVAVPLQQNYNVAGFATAGTAFNGGFDGNGESFSAAQLGSSITWRSIHFALGPPDALDTVSGGTVALPPGSYSSLLLLADLVNDETPGIGTFTLHYSDGTTGTVTQPFSDWVRPRNLPGESNVLCVPDRIFASGAQEPNSTCVYGYSLPLDSTKRVISVTLPNDRNIVVLAMALLPPIVPGTFAYTPAAGAYPQVGNTSLTAVFTPAATYSVAQASTILTVTAPAPALHTSLTWPAPAPVSVGTALGPAQLNAAASAAANAVTVPLRDAARVNAFYHDGAAYLEKGFDGKNAAFSTQELGSTLQYRGATFTLGPPDVQNAATSSTVQLPRGNYTALYLLGAAALSAQPGQVFTLTYTDGTTSTQMQDLSSWTSSSTYPNETVVATTTHQNLSDCSQQTVTSHLYGYTLSVDATRTVQSLTLPMNPDVIFLAAGLGTGAHVPVDGTYTYTPAAGTVLAAGVTPLHLDFSPANPNLFTPQQADTTVTALRPELTLRALNASRPYGAPNPAFTGSIQGAIGGDTFTEQFSTSATQFSAPGTYAVVPTASGGNLNGYQVTTVPGTLTITAATSIASLSSPQSSALQGSAVTLVVTIASATSGTPTGSVNLFANGKLIATSVLVNGSAQIVTSQLPVGSVNLTCTYTGDMNFLPSAASLAVFPVSPRDFLLTANHGSLLTGTMGGSFDLTFHLTPLNGTYSTDAVFSVSGDLPNNTYATFTPETLPEQSSAADVVMTLHTRKYSVVHNPFQHPEDFATLAALIGLPFVGLRRKRLTVSLAVLFGTLLLSATGCGTGYAAHTYNFQLTATTGTVSHSIPLTLQIQASPQ